MLNPFCRPFKAGWLKLALAALLFAGCRGGLPAPRPAPTQAPPPAVAATRVPAPTLAPTATRSAIPPRTATATATASPSRTPSPRPSLTPTQSATPTITPTPTFAFPTVRVLMRAFCRYGPGKAYLYSHELKEGDQAEIHGRNAFNTWLWIQPLDLNRHCWVSASVVEISGDIRTVVIAQTKLPHATLYGPPENVKAVRAGDSVTVSWKRVDMTEDDDRGYLIEATVCQDGQLVWLAVQTYDNYYEFSDAENCSGDSGGKLYTVEKHGYTDPVPIPWPED